MPIARSSSNFLNLEFLQKWRHFSSGILLQNGVKRSFIWNSFWLFGLYRRRWGKWGLKTKKGKHTNIPNQRRPQQTSIEAQIINFLVSFYSFPTKLMGSGVLKLLSPQNLGNFSFKESSKLKREITLKNLDGKFQGWLIKILEFNTLKPNVRSMNSKLQFHN